MSRIEIEKEIDPKRKNNAQGPYYGIHSSGLVFINKYSIYNDKYINEYNIEWEDSLGKRNAPGDLFFKRHKNYFFFKEISKSPKRYALIGEMRLFKKIENGYKGLKPNKYRITFKTKISKQVKNLFDNFSTKKY